MTERHNDANQQDNEQQDNENVTQPDHVEAYANMGTLSGLGDQGHVRHIEPTDSLIHQEALTLLKHDPLVEHESLRVSVADGVVTLRGTVRHPNERAAIEERIKLLAGVKQVQNELEIGPPLKSKG